MPAGVEQQIVYVFNKFTKAFIREVKKENVDIKNTLKENYICFDKSTDEYIKDFKLIIENESIKQKFESGDIQNDTEIQELEVLKGLNTKQIESDVKYYYLYLFYILSELYNDLKTTSDLKVSNSYKSVLVNILKIVNGSDDVESILEEIYDTKYCKLMTHLGDFRTKYLIEEETDTTDDPFDMSALNGSKIGQLAQEISSQIDMSSLQQNNINDVNDLFSGENNAMSSIIAQVSSVMSNKMQNGELNQEDLMNEAFSMMGNMSQNGGMGSMMENMMNMMKK